MAQHVSGIGGHPLAWTKINKFHIARYQFAQLKIELTYLKSPSHSHQFEPSSDKVFFESVIAGKEIDNSNESNFFNQQSQTVYHQINGDGTR